jgi:hypothetical protein
MEMPEEIELGTTRGGKGLWDLNMTVMLNAYTG